VTDGHGCEEPRTSRWLPATVCSIFALLLVVDAVVLLFFSNRGDLLENDGLEVAFIPTASATEEVRESVIDVDSTSSMLSPDGGVAVEVSDIDLTVWATGELVIRFQAPDAGSNLLLKYRFGGRRSGARCELTLARMASRWGVDTVWHRSLDGSKRSKGRIHHHLADHVGWFELRIRVNRDAAAVGFGITLPEIYWE
jgi:hypothetical protein